MAPAETREVRFLAGEPGTYIYSAATSDKPLEFRDSKEKLLSGGFVVDAPGANTDDQIFVIGIWAKITGTLGEEIATLNGKAWPFTERMTLKQGQTYHWRVINPSEIDHAMHLHGFYFNVDGVGDGEHYERYSDDQRRLAVTEHVDDGHVFEMTWTPDRAGNWLFHCHMVLHMSPSESLHPKSAEPAGYSPEHEHATGMGGLVIGITVLPDAAAPAPVAATVPRKLQLVISENPAKVPLYTLEVNDPKLPVAVSTAPDKDKPPSLLGPPIILTRGETTEIEIKNQTSGPTAIHWHGMELESYFDGVPGWTGSGQSTTPPVAPGTSFVARMTPPRAGTFIYHTHWHDDKQLLNGVYGPLIVLESGQKYDPDHDRTFVFSVGKYVPFGFLLLLNGNPQPDPIELHAGTPYRRLINISDGAADLRVRLTSNDALVKWKVIAKDGADLPPAQLKSSTADMGITVGETYDVEYQADSPSLAELKIWEPSFPSPVIVPLQFVAPK